MKKASLLLLINLMLLSCAFGQVSDTSLLFKELAKQDSLLFENGFNNCDLKYLDMAISDNLVFYHDKTGIQNKNDFIESIRKNICGNLSNKPIRKIDKGSLSVFPLYKDDKLYGAIQNGVHEFYVRTSGREDLLTGRAKFTHIYLLENGKWLLKEVLSFDHIPSIAAINTNESFDKEIEELLIRNNVPAMGLGIIKNGQLTQIKAYGVLKKNVPTPYNSIFKIASLTKPIVSLLTLKLIDNGQIGLDEPLYQYWVDPDIASDKRHQKITPRVILSHQTGFPNWRADTQTKKLQFEFQPGTKYQYSGEGFVYLQRALENKFKKSIDILADSLLFKPLKMYDTHFWWDKSLDTLRVVGNYDTKGNKYGVYKYYEANAAGSILTTIEDYGKFMIYLLEHGGLSDKLYKEVITPQVKIKENDFIGLGWEILTHFSNDEFALMHTGKIEGANTLAVLFPQSNNGYVIFLNGDNFLNVYQKLLTEYLYRGKELWERK